MFETLYLGALWAQMQGTSFRVGKGNPPTKLTFVSTCVVLGRYGIHMRMYTNARMNIQAFAVFRVAHAYRTATSNEYTHGMTLVSHNQLAYPTRCVQSHSRIHLEFEMLTSRVDGKKKVTKLSVYHPKRLLKK